MKYVKWHMYLPETLQLQPRVVNASEIFTHLWVKSYSPELFTCKVTWSYKQAFFNLEWSLQSNLRTLNLDSEWLSRFKQTNTDFMPLSIVSTNLVKKETRSSKWLFCISAFMQPFHIPFFKYRLSWSNNQLKLFCMSVTF